MAVDAERNAGRRSQQLRRAILVPCRVLVGGGLFIHSLVRMVTIDKGFEPGGAIPFPETHVMEHGLYVLEGKAVYLLNKDWVEVQEGDFMWLRAFCPQACYAGGPGRVRYLLYKDVNRHMKLRL